MFLLFFFISSDALYSWVIYYMHNSLCYLISLQHANLIVLWPLHPIRFSCSHRLRCCLPYWILSLPTKYLKALLRPFNHSFYHIRSFISFLQRLNFLLMVRLIVLTDAMVRTIFEFLITCRVRKLNSF